MGPVIAKIATAISAIVLALDPLNVFGDRPRGTRSPPPSLLWLRINAAAPSAFALALIDRPASFYLQNPGVCPDPSQAASLAICLRSRFFWAEVVSANPAIGLTVKDPRAWW